MRAPVLWQAQVRYVKLSNILAIETRPFTAENFDREEEEAYIDDTGIRRVKLKDQNTLRWRYAPGPDGEVGQLCTSCPAVTAHDLTPQWCRHKCIWHGVGNTLLAARPRGVKRVHCGQGPCVTSHVPVQVVKQSNARFVRWSDGSLQLFLGEHVLDVTELDIANDHHYLFVRHQGLIQVPTI